VFYGSLGQPDIVDKAVEGVEVVYHVGAAMKGGKEEFEQGTIWGTRNIVESCVKHKVKRLVYVSSMSVMDHAGAVAPITEDSALEPYPERRGAYTQTKLKAEQMVLDAIRDKGLQAVIIRPGQIFGKGAEKVTPNGVIGIAGKWIVAGMGGRNVPLIYRDDVVDALLQAETTTKALGKVINVVDPYKIDQNEYLRQAAPALTGIGVMRLPVPVLMALSMGIEALGAVLKKGVPLTRYRIRSLRPLSGFDLTRATELLGWKPRVGVAEGMRRTFGKV
jgi:2-alkyl-3-oxoalkanoate reductase